MTTLRVALIGGDQYDHVDAMLAEFTERSGIGVHVAHRGDHPALNRAMAKALPDGEPLDLVCTHSKYAPSQAPWLRPLDDLADVSGFGERALRLCSYEGALLCVPRMVDVRLLWTNAKLLGSRPVPGTWDELLETAVALAGDGVAGYVFPGVESGLFGTFFELVVAAGGRLFDERDRPAFVSDEARHALAWLVEAGGCSPEGSRAWHYDEVSRAFRDGRAAMAGDWPAFYGYIPSSPVAGDARVHRYPSGRARRAVYAGVHGFAIPRAAAHPSEAAQLLAHLTSRESQAFEAARGPIPARADVEVPARDDRDRRRGELLRITIEEDMLTFPALTRYPEVEDAGWRALHAALSGETDVDTALRRVQADAERALS